MSLRVIAQIAGVSPSTVSLALRGSPSIKASTRRHVLKIAQEHGYRPDARLTEAMSRLRLSREPQSQACFGVVSFYDSPKPWEQSLHLARIYNGMKKRAIELGYSLDPLWLRAPGMTAARLRGILEARGIRGLLCLGSPKPDIDFPAQLSHFTVVVQGPSVNAPLHRILVNGYRDMRRVLEKLRSMGYQRPGLIVNRYEAVRSEEITLSAYLGWWATVPGLAAVIPELRIDEVEDVALMRWIRVHRPDCIVVMQTYNHLPHLMSALSRNRVKVPDDIGVAALSQILEGSGVSGMEGNGETMGAWAVELLASRLANGDFGISPQPRVELVDSKWVEGQSLRTQV